MAVTEIVRMYAKDDTADDLEKALGVAAESLLADSECTHVRILRGVEDPTAFVLNVEWTSLEAHRAWLESENRTSFRAALGDLRADRPSDVGHYAELLDRS